MGKHKSKKEWIFLFKKYEKNKLVWNDYYQTLGLKNLSKSRCKNQRTWSYKLKEARRRFIDKYKLWKIDDNLFMKKNKKKWERKKRTKKEIKQIVDSLTEKELKDIAEKYIEENDKNKKKAGSFEWQVTRKAYIFNLDRSTFYKKPKERIYKFNHLQNNVRKIFEENYKRYGSGRIAIELKKQGHVMPERTLRDYMDRWNLHTKTRVKKKNRESKNTKVPFKDLVKRNFNPKKDNIVATDVTYIPANSKQNFVYLSIGISHKTKLIEAWKLGVRNDNLLVQETILALPYRENGILHSDHATQYSSKETIQVKTEKGYLTSMGRVGNCLDNREAEYFFGCIKSELLNHLPTHNMSYNKIYSQIDDYINWYNTKRIQKRLQWKTPANASNYVV